MNPLSDIKRFVLRALLRLNGIPWPDALLDEAARHRVMPRPLQSDVSQAKREMERDGFIQGNRDDLDGMITWTLTDKGCHKAREIEQARVPYE
jgi:DNA-binding MarR family transcriptional regulator